MFKLSAPDWCFLKPGVEPAAHYARLKALGYGAVEMTKPEHRAAARAAGLEVINLSGPGMQRGLNRREHHAELLPQIRACIAEAAAERIGQVIVFSGNRDCQREGEGRANCIAALRDLAPDAARAGVVLILEMLNSFDHRDYQADRSDYGFAVVKAVGSPAVRALYDVFHMVKMGDDPQADLAANLPLVAHIHLAEVPARTTPLPEGRIAHRALARQVAAAGYRGWWGMEFCTDGDVYAELEKAKAALV